MRISYTSVITSEQYFYMQVIALEAAWCKSIYAIVANSKILCHHWNSNLFYSLYLETLSYSLINI